MAKDRFSINVLAVIRIFDSFTSKPIKNGYLRFSCSNNSKIIFKDDGFFVIVGNEKPDNIIIESTIYKNMVIDISDTKPNIPLNLWAEPQKGYNLVKNISWINVKAKPFEKIYAFEECAEPNIRLLENAKKGSLSLKIYRERKFNLDGSCMLVYSKDGFDKCELVCINSIENDYCVLNKPLEKDHKKIKTGLYKLMYATADEQGNCNIAVLKQEETVNYAVLNSLGEKIEDISV